MPVHAVNVNAKALAHANDYTVKGGAKINCVSLNALNACVSDALSLFILRG